MLRTNNSIRTIPVLLALALACGGPPASKEPMPVGLTGIKWRLTTLNGSSPRVSATGQDASLELTESRSASGYSGCNRFSGTYTMSGDGFRLGPLITTRMACPGNLALEQEYLAALGAVDRVQVTSDSLVLYQGETPTAVYKR
jgi:heat shock protein HslJ